MFVCFRDWLSAHCFRLPFTSLQQEIESLHSRALLDSQSIRMGLVRFISKFRNYRSTILDLAVPGPQTRAIFTWNGRRHPLILPPTYAAFDDTTKQVENLLAKYSAKKVTSQQELHYPSNYWQLEVVLFNTAGTISLCLWTRKLFPNCSRLL